MIIKFENLETETDLMTLKQKNFFIVFFFEEEDIMT